MGRYTKKIRELSFLTNAEWKAAMEKELNQLVKFNALKPVKNVKPGSAKLGQWCKPCSTKRSKYKTRNLSTKPRVSTWNTATVMMCNFGKLINLSKISSSSSKDGHHETVLFDSGANCCVSNRKEDFVGQFKYSTGTELVDGIGKGLMIKGSGRVSWTFPADNGTYRTLVLPCYYIPSATTRIASIQEILNVYPNETVTMKGSKLVLSGWDKHPSVTIQLCAVSNLPFGITTKPVKPAVHVNKKDQSTKTEILPSTSQPALTRADNVNLTEPEKELLRWHSRLGHIGMKRIQWLFRQGLLARGERSRRLQAAASKLTHGPLCTACQYAKQRRKTTPGTTTKTIKSEVDSLKQDELFPGSEISIDHFHCKPLGRLLHTYGKEKADAKYKGGCIFVDHATGYVHTELQTSLNSHSTLAAKLRFDEMCASHGVVPQKFLSDNGTSFCFLQKPL